MTSASNPDDFDLRVKGIVGASDRWETNKSESAESSIEGYTK